MARQPSSATRQIRLVGGPFDGSTFDIAGRERPGSLLFDLAEPGAVARYRPTRDPGVYRFREFDTIVARLPLPETTL